MGEVIPIRYEIKNMDGAVCEHTGEGYIILAREMYKQSKTWQSLNPIQKTIMITLLLMTNHKNGQWWDGWSKEWVPVKRGQIITSLDSIKKACGKGISIQNIRTALLVLEKMGFLTNQSTKHYRLITIVNYDFYQSQENYLTKQSTRSQQSSNKVSTTNKHDKHDKQGKQKNIYADHVTLTKEEHRKLIQSLGEQKTADMIERLSLYKGSTGKKYASDYLTILNWMRMDKDRQREGQTLGHHDGNRGNTETDWDNYDPIKDAGLWSDNGPITDTAPRKKLRTGSSRPVQ
jgi:hypothetical protein